MLGGDEIDEAPVKIDHAPVAGGLIRFITGEAEQLVAQGREGISVPYPDDYVELLMSMVLAPKRMAPVPK